MNTFLSYEDFARSAACLDRARLGKQRVEVLQLARALLCGGSWSTSPAAKMWEGNEGALILYGLKCCEEWIRRGYKDSCHEKLCELIPNTCLDNPEWIGGEIHASHRSNLLRKDPVWYGQFGWTEPPNLPYVWPRRKA